MINILLVAGALALASIAWSLLAAKADRRGHTAFVWLASFLAMAALAAAIFVLVFGYAMTKVPL